MCQYILADSQMSMYVIKAFRQQPAECDAVYFVGKRRKFRPLTDHEGAEEE
jgi:hypothetical protein